MTKRARCLSVTITRVSAGILLLSLAGCAHHYTREASADPYGFLSGLWHGFIVCCSVLGVFISWCAGLFGIDVLSSVQIIGRPNTGFWYYVGFAVGILGPSSLARSNEIS